MFHPFACIMETKSKKMVMDATIVTQVLDCPICSKPLSPPVLQCSLGHFVCSTCHGKLPGSKCHSCSRNSFERSHGMKRVLDSIMVPCSYDEHGCADKVTYRRREKHEKACPATPCFCPDSGCGAGFAGSPLALLDHIKASHKQWPVTISSGLNKRKGEAQHDGESVVIKKSRVMDMEVLHCPVCFQIMRPPVFQCGLGHLVCSPCRDNLPGGKCPSPSCSRKPSVRCVGMEPVVNSIVVACAYAEHGCPDKIAYVNITEHEKTCPHAPCFCPESGCGFAAASTAALADHFTALHNWPSHKFRYCQPFDLRFHPGKNVLIGEEDGTLFLLNAAPAAEHVGGHAVVSLVSVRPHDRASGFRRSVIRPTGIACHFRCLVEFSCFLGHHQCSTLDTVTSSSLSDGMPEEWFFTVPELQVSVDGDAGVGVVIRITIDRTTSTGYSRQRSSVATATNATIDLDHLLQSPQTSSVPGVLILMHFWLKRLCSYRATSSSHSYMQCGVGHVICSSCHGNLLDTRRCHMCNRDGGYRRCMAVEHILNSIMVSCPKTAYHDSDGHAGGCPHAPCFCPEPGCGATAALLAQFTDTHGWPATMMWHRRAVGIPLQEGKQVLSLLDADGRGRHLFLLNVAPAGEAGLVGTVLAVEAAAAAAHGHGDAPRFECQVSFDRRGTGWRQSSTFGVRITNLSDGLPVDCFAFVAPKVNPPPAAATSVSVTLFDISTGEPGNALRPVLPRSRRSHTRLSARQPATTAAAVSLR
uniref:RING-type E3 ubiquitin transferase n=1 Tax=Oryza punctata TaxID=4537 RepID=A0A0E0JDJ1_ORYPU